MDLSTIKRITLWFGIFYLLIGVLGFIPGITTPATGPVPGTGMLLGIFAVNLIHNIAHLIIGAVLAWAGTSDDYAVVVNKVMALVFAVLVVGSFITPIAEGVAINLADTVLHLLSLLLTGYLGYLAPRGVTASRT